MVEALQQREASLVQDAEALRGALAAARLELVEAANTNARSQAEFGDLTNTLAAATVEADRRARENKLLREKNVSLSIDLEKALKREDEARHRLDAFSTIHDEYLVDIGEGRRTMRNNDDDASTSAHPRIAPARAASPSTSRFEFGSSRTTRNGSP